MVKELSRETSSWWVILVREHLAGKDFYGIITGHIVKNVKGTHSLLWDHEARTQHVFSLNGPLFTLQCNHVSSVAKSKKFKWLSGERVRWLKVLTGEGLKDSNLAYLLIFRVGEKIVVVATGRMRKKRRGEKCRHSRWILVWDGKTIYAITLATRLPFSR